MLRQGKVEAAEPVRVYPNLLDVRRYDLLLNRNRLHEIGLRHSRQFVAISLTIVLISGLGTWLIAPAHTVHIGASGLIFGYFGFLLAAAYTERSPRAIGLALIVIVFYGGLLWGALPQNGPISWQGHLFGLVGGAVAARAFAPRPVQIRIHPQ